MKKQTKAASIAIPSKTPRKSPRVTKMPVRLTAECNEKTGQASNTAKTNTKTDSVAQHPLPITPTPSKRKAIAENFATETSKQPKAVNSDESNEDDNVVLSNTTLFVTPTPTKEKPNFVDVVAYSTLNGKIPSDCLARGENADSEQQKNCETYTTSKTIARTMCDEEDTASAVENVIDMQMQSIKDNDVAQISVPHLGTNDRCDNSETTSKFTADDRNSYCSMTKLRPTKPFNTQPN
jgi:hypothetical protein